MPRAKVKLRRRRMGATGDRDPQSHWRFDWGNLRVGITVCGKQEEPTLVAHRLERRKSRGRWCLQPAQVKGSCSLNAKMVANMDMIYEFTTYTICGS